jgi:hypothetical protein
MYDKPVRWAEGVSSNGYADASGRKQSGSFHILPGIGSDFSYLTVYPDAGGVKRRLLPITTGLLPLRSLFAISSSKLKRKALIGSPLASEVAEHQPLVNISRVNHTEVWHTFSIP